MRGAVSFSVTPIMLGFGNMTLKTARSLFFKYFLVSNVFDRNARFYIRLLPFVSFVRLAPSQSDSFTLMALDRFTSEYGDSTYLLIPCTEEFKSFTERNRDALESRFIIRSPEQILEYRELFPLATSHGKDN